MSLPGVALRGVGDVDVTSRLQTLGTGRVKEQQASGGFRPMGSQCAKKDLKTSEENKKAKLEKMERSSVYLFVVASRTKMESAPFVTLCEC